MLTEVKKTLALMGRYFVFNLAASMEYRGSFLLQVFGMALNNASFIFFWWIAFRQLANIGGYTFQDVMFIWALAASSFGVAHIFFGNIGSLTDMILQGELDPYLLQPRDVCINVLCSKTSISSWGDFLYGYVLFFFAYGFDPVRLLYFTLFVLTGGLLTGAIFLTSHTLTFFLGNAGAVARLVREFLISFSIYPEGIFNNITRLVLFTLLPAGFITYVPLRIFKAPTLPFLLLLLAVDAVYVSFAYWFFQQGIKRYESGNLIVTKL